MKRFYLAASCLLVTSVMGAYPLGAPKLHSPQEATGVDNEVIYEAPEGESKNYSENYSGWMFWGSDFGLYYSADNKAYNEIVWTSDSKVYIFDPVKTSPTNSYAVGTYADGKSRCSSLNASVNILTKMAIRDICISTRWRKWSRMERNIT